jgi:hypothetical protein
LQDDLFGSIAIGIDVKKQVNSEEVQRIGGAYALALRPVEEQILVTGGHCPKPEHLAWAAGFIDGEACISVVTQLKPDRRATSRVRLQIVQNHLPVLAHLQAVLGGSGRIHEIQRTTRHNRQLYTLLLDGARAAVAISRVAPYLVRKKQEAEVLLNSLSCCWFGVYPGPNGYPPYVWEARRRLQVKLQRMK